MLQRAETAATLAGVDASRAFFEQCFDAEARETLLVAHVDEAARCIHLSRHASEKGEAGLPVGQIIADAARLGSSGLVLAQDQSGGDLLPTRSEVQATRQLATAGEALDLTVLDRLTFADGQCTSMRRMGLL